MIRAIRFARALAFAGTGAATACSSDPGGATETPDTSDTMQPDTQLADSGANASDTAVVDVGSGTDTRVASDGSSGSDAETNGETGGGVGHCYTADDGQILCAEGQMCTFAGRVLDCLDTPPSPVEGADATVQACGVVSCALNGACFCANDKTSFCVCDYGAGPLPPPELPTSAMKRGARTKRSKRTTRSSRPRRGGTSLA